MERLIWFDLGWERRLEGIHEAFDQNGPLGGKGGFDDMTGLGWIFYDEASDSEGAGHHREVDGLQSGDILGISQ